MSTNINVITRFKYVYYCKTNKNVQTYITNLICSDENQSLHQFYSLILKKKSFSTKFLVTQFGRSSGLKLVYMAVPSMINIPDQE